MKSKYKLSIKGFTQMTNSAQKNKELAQKQKEYKYIYLIITKENYINMLPDNHIKEGLSRAYVKAICNYAGCGIALDEMDFGDDLTIKKLTKRKSGRVYSTGHRIDIQLKSTINYREDKENIIYDLRNKNYNDLVIITKTGTKKILVLLILPRDKREWINQDINSLVLKKCAYWCSLGGKDEVGDSDSTTVVKIPKNQVFSVENLKQLMEKIERGEDLNE